MECDEVVFHVSTIGKPIPFSNQVLFPNYEIKPEPKVSSTLTPLELPLNFFFSTFPEPPDFYYSVESAVLLQDITHPPNATTNLYYFVRTSDKENT